MGDPRDTAQQLRERLNDHASDVEEVARDAEGVFLDLGLSSLQRWIRLERRGYGQLAQASALHDALGVAPNDRLVVHVLSYRVQSGQIVEAQGKAGPAFRHFFVESIHDVLAAAARVRHGQGAPLRLDFGGSGYPLGAVFSPDVFERLALGFRATLHLQLATVADS